MQAHILRKKFLDFFKSKKHRIFEPDSLVPKDDPTVLFTPAGMNQFKREFMGFDSGFARAATCQRCLRTDDLEKVGKTSGHHTFFEMLGNFSFGDYFKKEAILYAWEFLTETLKIKKDSLWVSVYKGDTEAYKIWKDLIKIPEAKIIKLGDKENFWPSEAKQKGPNGPCGPCSEVFFDQGKKVGCGESGCDPSCDCGRFLEIWNLVFTQFNRKEGGVLEPLPNKNIDTGMGLERLTAVMQRVPNNFETDLFQPIIKEIVQGLSGDSPLRDESPAGNWAVPKKALIYAVADHIRAITFAIYDGVLPSNEARGYVVRKLVRKATLHLKTLGFTHPFLYKLVPVVAEVMKPFYPDLENRKENISEIILAEEKSFIFTLNSSPKLLEEEYKELLNKHKKLLEEKQNIGDAVFEQLLSQESIAASATAFRLYDTYGIPFEQTKIWLDKHGIVYSEEIFDGKMRDQKVRSKLQSSMKGDVFSFQELDFGSKETKFLGFEDYSTKAKILKILVDNKEAKKISAGDKATIVLDKTCFYPESGGQVGDTGEIMKAKNIFEVLDTKKVGKVILHTGKVKSGSFKNNDAVLSKIDVERRLSIARNHTAIHLLQAALRRVLGEHVKQQGSLVAGDRLRFDFTHFKALDKEQLGRVEELVNSFIMNNYELSVKEKSLAEAKKSGALAFFGEKYEGRVRIVCVDDISHEFCGGTHLNYTGQIGMFKIIQEGSVASGVRRIEAATGTCAYKIIKEQSSIIDDVSSVLGVQEDKIIQELDKRNNRIKELEKKLQGEVTSNLEASIDTDIEKKVEVNGVNFVTHIGTEINELKRSVDLIKAKMGKNVIVAATTGTNLENKIIWVLGATEDLCEKGIDASKLFAIVSAQTGGSGGGRKDFVQGGGNNPANFKKALEKLKEAIGNIK